MLPMKGPQGDEANDLTTQIRHGQGMKDKIEQAAALLGVNKSVFLRWAVEQQCAQVLEQQQRHQLTEADAVAFAAALEAPVATTLRAAQVADDFAKRVGHAD